MAEVTEDLDLEEAEEQEEPKEPKKEKPQELSASQEVGKALRPYLL